MIYLATDWHLWKYNKTLKQCIRTKKYDKILSNAKDILTDSDILLYLGDLTDDEMQDPKKIAGLLSDIKGYKILIRGNNDKMEDKAYIRAGFDKVVDVVTLGNIIFTHKPIYVDLQQLNIHGHNHGKDNEFATDRNIDIWTDDRSLVELSILLKENEPDFAIPVKNQFWEAITPKHDIVSGEIFDLEEFYKNGVDGKPVDESVFRNDDSMDIADFLEAIEEAQTPQEEKEAYLKNIYSLVEAYFTNTIIGEQKRMDESLEFALSKHIPVKDGMVMLYHGSPKHVTSIEPRSINVGTKFSNVRNSSFWSDNPFTALMMGIWRALADKVPNFMSVDCEFSWYIDFRTSKIHVPKSHKKNLDKYLKDLKIYVYEANVPAKYVGRGHDMDLGEYTIDFTITPHAFWEIDKKDLYSVIAVDSDADFNAKLKATGYANIKPKISFRDRLIYYPNFRNKYKQIKQELDDARQRAVEQRFNKPVYEAIAPADDVEDAIDNIFSHNSVVRLWVPDVNDNGEPCERAVYYGMAWDIPEEYQHYEIMKVMDIVDDEHLGCIHILIRNRSVDEAIDQVISDTFFNEDDETGFMDEAFVNKKKAPAKNTVDSKRRLYPVYITLFSNDTSFGKLIRKATGSEYSHATVALDSTMNNMYSFSDVPYNEAKFFCAGFVRESIWSPEYTKNRHFRVLVTFVNKEGRDNIQKKIDYFVKNFEQYDYNDIGLVQYYFKFKNTKKHDETKKMRWFCSEFVSAMVNASDEIGGFENILASPEDLLSKPNVFDLGKFTIPTFKEEDLIKRTKLAEKEFRIHSTLSNWVVTESVGDYHAELIDEVSVRNLFKKEKKERKEKFKERDVQKYTYNLDWKRLYEKFIELFPKNDPATRFDLFGLIVRYFLVPTKAAAVNVTEQIIEQMQKIASVIKNGFIKLIDTVRQFIFFDAGEGDACIKYPTNEVIKESIDNLDEVLFQDFEDAGDFETDDEVSRRNQDPDRQPTYRIKFKKKRVENLDVPSVDESAYDLSDDNYYLTESQSIISLSYPLMQDEMHKAMLDMLDKYPIQEASAIINRQTKPNKNKRFVRTIHKGEFDKSRARQKARKEKDPLRSTSPLEGLGASIEIDQANSMIIITGLDFRKMLARVRNMYDTKRVNKLFDPTYSSWSLYLYNTEQITKNEMKIKDLKVPLFFALELQQIFYDLADYYQLSYYNKLGDAIYNKTWVSNVDKPVQRTELNLDKAQKQFTLQPMDYQLQYVKEYFTITRCYNFDGHILTFKPGYGKTFTAALIAEAAPDVNQVIVVCPNTLKENWAEEIHQYYKKYQGSTSANEKFKKEVFVAGNSRYTFDKSAAKWIIVNQESIPTVYDKVKRQNVMIVVDECHYFRNMDAIRVKELLKLKDITNATEILMMSGTPIHASPDEAIPALLMIDPMFTYDLAKIYKAAFATDNTALERVINARMGIVMYDVPDEVLKLPKKTVSELWMPLANDEQYSMHIVQNELKNLYLRYYANLGKEADQYREAFVDIVKEYSSADSDVTESYISFVNDGSNYLSIHESKAEIYRTFLKTYVYPNVPHDKMQDVKDVMSHYVYMSSKARGLAMGQIIPPLYNKVNIALWDENEPEFIDRIRNNLKKTLIFSPYVKVVNHIEDRLKANKIGVIKVTGEVVKNRMDLVKQFRNSDTIDVMIATPNTMGTGLTLVEASQVFFFGVPYRSADFDQACDRIYRIGQTSDVNIYKVLLKSATGVANITTRQNEIMEWSREMSKAYTKGAKEQIEFNFEFSDISESATAIDRATNFWGDYDPNPVFGKQSMENNWDSDYDDSYHDDEVQVDESWEDSIPDDVDGDNVPHVDGTDKDFVMQTDPLIGDIWDDYDKPIIGKGFSEGAVEPGSWPADVIIPISVDGKVYYQADVLKQFVRWLKQKYLTMKRALVHREIMTTCVAELQIIIAWMNKLYILADKSVHPDNKQMTQEIITVTERLLRKYAEDCQEQGISWKDVQDQVRQEFNLMKEELDTLKVVDTVLGKAIVIHME